MSDHSASATLRLVLAYGASPANVTLHDDELTVVEEVFLAHPAAGEHSIELPSGRYVASVRRPNGSGYQQRFALEPGGTRVDVGETRAPHDWLRGAAQLGELPAAGAGGVAPLPLPPLLDLTAFVNRAPGATGFPSTLAGSQLSATSLSLMWRASGQNQWRYLDADNDGDGDELVGRNIAYNYARFRIEAPMRGVAAIEVRHANGPSVFVRFPGSLHGVHLLARPQITAASVDPAAAGVDVPAEPPLTLRLIADDDEFQGILQFLDSSSPDAAESMLSQVTLADSEQWDDIASLPDDASYTAYTYMLGKFASPAKAAGSGLFLLRFGQLERTRDWSRNLADYFPWLPDGAVLEGWRRLLSAPGDAEHAYPEWRMRRPPPAGFVGDTPAPPNADRPTDPLLDASLRFIEAVGRGVPVFAEGLRQLDAGLRYCARSLGENEPQLAERLTDCIREIQPYVRYRVDAGAFTAYTGSAVDAPGLEAASPLPSALTLPFATLVVTPWGFQPLNTLVGAPQTL